MTNGTTWELAEVSGGGERVVHLVEDSCFHAHRSIYEFAAPYCMGRRVLDAGCGTGYGSHLLAAAGAQSVVGVDLSAPAVAFSAAHFQAPNLRFAVQDLATLSDLPPSSFDVIFSSNTLEHLPDVWAFLGRARELLAPDGVLIIAVPPITDDYLRAANVGNPYHFNIWSPAQWHSMLGAAFEFVEAWLHGLGERGTILDFNQPSAGVVPSSAWIFEQVSAAELATIPTLTAIFVARQPVAALPAAPPAFVDNSFTRDPADRTARLLAELVAAREQTFGQQTWEWSERAAAQQRRIAELEAIIATKNAHILQCERLIGRLQHGRVLRILGWLTGQRG